ncbi:M48 family metallopeptidase [Pseudidiomarina aestuarii]|uniref:M48 family metallopeptidase n=1 Tax=Pseudidiomarina aestuarii TaxID=624146 RepID=UPI003A97D93B
MVNFFEHQQQARRNTLLLVFLFVLAFFLIIGLVVALAAVTMGGVTQTPGSTDYVVQWKPLGIIAAAVGGAILLIMMAKWVTLKPGGHVVAEQLGGVRIAPDSQDPVQRRVLNVVEEMAIAANMPVPAVYILPNEAGINAFAAGYETKDAAIGLTQGSIETFSREELQAVVAHEFSHILNGDMRLNIRLIAALAGILALAHFGRIMLHSARFRSRGRNNNNILPLVGIALMIIGGVGVFFGNIIKAAVSRQREYLADAAAVQFTRNPEGLAGALQQIGARQHGSRVQHQNADEVAHLFFGQALSKWFSLMATHPPLDKRIKRIQPRWNGHYPEPRQAFVESKAEQVAKQPKPSALDQLALLALPALLLERARSPQHAPELVRSLISSSMDTAASDLVNELATLGPSQQLALIELAVPALRLAPESKRIALIHDLQLLEHSTDLFHWCLYQLLARQLLPKGAFKDTLENKLALDTTCSALQQAEAGESVDYAQLSAAITTIKRWSPQQKQRVVEGWTAICTHDGVISTTEKKLVATLCACIESPLPDTMFE